MARGVGYQPPKTATELGITAFAQSPYLDDRDLPPVEERLPDDPVVIQPYRSIGKYGGTARTTIWDSWQFFNWEHALTLSADMRNVLPNLAESWSLSEDGRITTVKLRAGLKWSDGAPLTADDFYFRLVHVWMDPEMSPIVYRLVQGCEFVKIDDLTFQYVFPEPNPMFANFFAQYGSHFVDPMHFFKQYHPAFRDREELAELVEEGGLRDVDGHVRGLAGLGQRGRPESADPARLQGGAANPDQDAPGTQPLATSRSTRRGTSYRISTPSTRSSCWRTPR